jgi:hypothetical protein
VAGASARMPVNNKPAIKFVINLIQIMFPSTDTIAAGAVKK